MAGELLSPLQHYWIKAFVRTGGIREAQMSAIPFDMPSLLTTFIPFLAVQQECEIVRVHVSGEASLHPGLPGRGLVYSCFLHSYLDTTLFTL